MYMQPDIDTDSNVTGKPIMFIINHNKRSILIMLMGGVIKTAGLSSWRLILLLHIVIPNNLSFL